MSTDSEGKIKELESELEALKGRHTKALMDLRFFQKATEHLNFHENAHDGIIYTDKNDKVIYANPYFLEMMGITDKETLLGKPIPDHIWQTPEDHPKLFADVRQAGFVRERELIFSNAANQPVFAMCSSVATRDEDGQFTGTELMFCNITSKRALQAELHTRTKQLERLFAFTNETVTNVHNMLLANCTREELLGLVKQLEAEIQRVEKEAQLP